MKKIVIAVVAVTLLCAGCKKEERLIVGEWKLVFSNAATMLPDFLDIPYLSEEIIEDWVYSFHEGESVTFIFYKNNTYKVATKSKIKTGTYTIDKDFLSLNDGKNRYDYNCCLLRKDMLLDQGITSPYYDGVTGEPLYSCIVSYNFKKIK